MSAPRVAVLMPAYNAAAYVENTVRSILRQSFTDLLLIAVDDGSTDETPAILARLAAEDPRVRVLTAENGGPAKARNLALDAVPEGTEYLRRRRRVRPRRDPPCARAGRRRRSCADGLHHPPERRLDAPLFGT